MAPDLPAQEHPGAENERCEVHERLPASKGCDVCGQRRCVLCFPDGATVCESCQGKKKSGGGFKTFRIVVLLVLLAIVARYAWMARGGRSTDWTRSQQVAVVIIERGQQEVDPTLVKKFKRAGPQVEAAMQEALSKYSPGANEPIQFSVFGPVPEQVLLPDDPGEGLMARFEFNRALSAYADVHDELAGLGDSYFDTRIYMRTSSTSGRLQVAEGISQQDGGIGVIAVEISDKGIDFAWFVVLHEFFHTCGALDKYGEGGLPLNPEGLFDPAQEPLYPQAGTEIMARGRPVSPVREVLPGPPSTWTVGEWSAREIGWLREQ